ncbi:hypothetical protein H696_00123 [Fonticula alba]|uniref:Myb-like domain-containing protein n=1 Tax=Fonticula alba TaxID=691883 RepID=A0A058ZF08_FONAL|nr:hypothetical protein H696_00123 [Fonticula alba]KCV72531.1 hypothetical protein H696_00123 [Fonticula alba]|eukprot:XP_009492232.1 hypothetical protein H696_00123 [Fonticula alba]
MASPAPSAVEAAAANKTRSAIAQAARGVVSNGQLITVQSGLTGESLQAITPAAGERLSFGQSTQPTSGSVSVGPVAPDLPSMQMSLNSQAPPVFPRQPVRPSDRRRCRPWEHREFSHPCRSDRLRVKRWMPASTSAEDSFPEANFHLEPVVMSYTDEEYQDLLQDLEWTRGETDLLLELIRKYDQRFAIISDQWPDDMAGIRPRRFEDIKARYYNVVSRLVIARAEAAAGALAPEPNESPEQHAARREALINAAEAQVAGYVAYDPLLDAARRQTLGLLLARPAAQVAEEGQLLAAAGAIEMRSRRAVRDRQQVVSQLSRLDAASAMAFKKQLAIAQTYRQQSGVPLFPGPRTGDATEAGPAGTAPLLSGPSSDSLSGDVGGLSASASQASLSTESAPGRAPTSGPGRGPGPGRSTPSAGVGPGAGATTGRQTMVPGEAATGPGRKHRRSASIPPSTESTPGPAVTPDPAAPGTATPSATGRKRDAREARIPPGVSLKSARFGPPNTINSKSQRRYEQILEEVQVPPKFRAATTPVVQAFDQFRQKALHLIDLSRQLERREQERRAATQKHSSLSQAIGPELTTAAKSRAALALAEAGASGSAPGGRVKQEKL